VDSITNTHKRNFYRRLSHLALPIVLQNLISAAVNSVDVLMLGYVSENALSAVSLANQLMFLLQGFFFGICSVDAMLVSQYWGKGDRKSIQAVMGIAFKLSFLVTALAAAAALFFPHLVMGIFTKDADLITLGSRYLRTIGIYGAGEAHHGSCQHRPAVEYFPQRCVYFRLVRRTQAGRGGCGNRYGYRQNGRSPAVPSGCHSV
jgi:Na+-driven multidrug efflux pump